MTRASAEHWMVDFGGERREDRWVTIKFDGWIVSEWCFSPAADRWFQTRRARPEHPEIPADVMADAQQEMRN